MKSLASNKIWLLSAILITLATLGVIFSPIALAGDGPPHGPSLRWATSLPKVVADRQIFNEDLTVESGQVINENVAVFRGDVEIEEEGAIRGNLSVFSGDVTVAGSVEGDLAVVGGDVEIEDTARISGNVSVVGGEVERAAGAYIGGNFVGGPRAQIDELNFEHEIPNVQVQVNDREFSRRPYIVTFFLRLLQAILWTLLITGLVVVLAWLFPRQIRNMKQTAVAEPALSFATGLIVSMAALLLGGLIFITICLAPFALLLWGILAILGLIGWAVISIWLGERIEETVAGQTRTQLHPLIPVALGALILTGTTFFAWSVLPWLGLIVAVLLGATGIGAVLVHLARRSNLPGGTSTGPSGGGPSAPPTGPTPPSSGAAEPGPSQSTDTPSDTDLDVTTVTVTEETPAASPETTEEVEVEATGLAEPSEGEPPAPEAPPAADSDFVTGEELGLSEAERAQLRQSAGVETPSDDFLKIRGIGPTFNRRLQVAGVTSYAQMAAMSAEELAEILGWPPERVVRDQLREQAAELAAQQ